MQADDYRSEAGQTATLVGNVRIRRGMEILTADKAFVDIKNNIVNAEGNVVFITPKDYYRAERMQYNFSTQKGIVYNGIIQTGQTTIEGAEITKIGDANYEAKDASYTSCTNCPPGWKLSGTHINATAGSYAYIKNPIVRLYGVPVLWLPYLVVPIKNQRQSGLLPPFYEFSQTNGFTIGDSFFWNIDQSTDATITAIHYKNRGLKSALEYRYVLDENSKGTLRGAFLNDRIYGRSSRFLGPDPRYSNPRAPEEPVPRYFLHYDHRFELPENFINNVNVNLVRDIQYPLDFQNELPGAGNPSLENRVSLSKNWENSHASSDIGMNQNLMNADPNSQNDNAIHRVPEIKYTYIPGKVFNSGMLMRLDTDYINLARASSTFDTPP
jgi:LPS-assembly protein